MKPAFTVALGLPFIAPGLREGGDEIELALAGRLPRVVGDGDIRGILHAHTVLSDGVNTLAEMAEAVRDRGWSQWIFVRWSQRPLCQRTNARRSSIWL
jgi:hypothetical protein